MSTTSDDEKYSDRITLRRYWQDGTLTRVDLFDGGWRTGSYDDDKAALSAARRREELIDRDDHAIPLSQAAEEGYPRVELTSHHAGIDLVEYGIRAYLWDPKDGSAPQVIIDIDNTNDDLQPLKIYRNDALVYDEKPKEATQ